MLQVSISDDKCKALQEAKSKNAELTSLKPQSIYIGQGWLGNAKDFPIVARKYWSVQDFLSIEDEHITKNTSILISRSMKSLIIESILATPAELFFNRKVQSPIAYIVRRDNRGKVTKQYLEGKRRTENTYFNRHTRDVPPLVEQQQVSVQDTSTGLWSQAKSIKPNGEPNSYIIETPDETSSGETESI
ncbi:hypothetical protein RRG08_042256 [Elysia crispata]|uniref:Uncharacterized protein n=1 Tax=Elysia crispata TaxID=231223 RepID=A0AAE1ASR5_9GAST|nr:hypothetical protein RRG08_042256 [Elysia crispata]